MHVFAKHTADSLGSSYPRQAADTMSSSDDLIELELIEALDELSNKVQEVRDAIRNENPASKSNIEMTRMNSIQNVTGLKLADVLDENDVELEDSSTQTYKNLLDSLQDLCDALFSW